MGTVILGLVLCTGDVVVSSFEFSGDWCISA